MSQILTNMGCLHCYYSVSCLKSKTRGKRCISSKFGNAHVCDTFSGLFAKSQIHCNWQVDSSPFGPSPAGLCCVMFFMTWGSFSKLNSLQSVVFCWTLSPSLPAPEGSAWVDHTSSGLWGLSGAAKGLRASPAVRLG